MVSFDSSDPGTANSDWAQELRLTAAPPLTPPADLPLVVLAAHPDDETLGAGGLLHGAAAAGRPVTVVLVTDGRASHASDSIAAVRAAEFDAALAALGVVGSHSLGYPDGTVREARDAVLADVAAILRPLPRAQLVAPWRGDGHRDHRVLGEVAAELADARGDVLWEYPIWLWHWGSPAHPDVPWDRLGRLPLAPAAQAAKRDALDAYGSQTTPRGDEPPQLHARFLENFDRAFETFVV
ncbi:LmbE family N-acetylglucosaminyl deacetylase [Frondihabitans sp. PhB188]|nr:LmbE family N-acetylglucosaminyl deacetylase [Frondihabitans sp. PhB188]